MQFLSRLLGFALVALALFLTCSRSTVIDNDDGNAVVGKVTVVAADVSECGGFKSGAERSARTEEQSGETLEWAYVAGTNTLDLMHTGLSLNCCGIHTIDAEFTDGVVILHEDDQPEPDGGRCRCLCDFDFRVAIIGIPAGIVGIRIELTVDDTTTVHWSGSIDLADGTGEIDIPVTAE